MRRSGWLTFSAIILIVAGIMRVIDAIWAFSYSGTAVSDLHGAIFGHSLTAYGVVWLLVGLVLVAAGFLLTGRHGLGAEISRWFGVVASAVASITAITWIPYYPVWALVYVGIAVLVIYGLVAHFEEAPRTEHRAGASPVSSDA